jgi:hypothetical protein
MLMALGPGFCSELVLLRATSAQDVAEQDVFEQDAVEQGGVRGDMVP